MELKASVNKIQKEVKKVLGVTNTPLQAHTTAIKARLDELGLVEPYTSEDCLEIATEIVLAVNKEQSSLTLQKQDMVVQQLEQRQLKLDQGQVIAIADSIKDFNTSYVEQIIAIEAGINAFLLAAKNHRDDAVDNMVYRVIKTKHDHEFASTNYLQDVLTQIMGDKEEIQGHSKSVEDVLAYFNSQSSFAD